MLQDNMKLNGALFWLREEAVRANGPVLEGHFQIAGEHGRFTAAAWLKPAEGNRSEYLAITFEPLGPDGKPQKYFGSLFVSQNKASDSSPDYYGMLNLTQERGGPTLRISGWERSGPKAKFLSLTIEPNVSKPAGSSANAGNKVPA
jgi:hypothetical protein